MREILTQLNEETGASGSLIMTPDGIMVAAAMKGEYEEDAMAAFASSMLLTLKRGLSALKARGAVSSCTLHAASGQVAFYDMSNSYLVLLSKSNLPPAEHCGAIERAIEKITSRRIA